MPPQKRNPHYPSRNPNLLPKQNFTEAHFAAYAEAIGRATLAWNSLHEALVLVLWALTGEENGIVSIAIWNELRSDSSKRDILLAASRAYTESEVWNIENVYGPIDVKRRDLITGQHDVIKYIFAKTKTLSEDRNNAVHAPLSYHIVGRTVRASKHQRNSLAIRLDKKNDILSNFEDLRSSAIFLRDMALRLEQSIRDDLVSLPEIPKQPIDESPKKKEGRQSPLRPLLDQPQSSPQ